MNGMACYMMPLTRVIVVGFPNPLAGVQCSFEHKAAAGPPKSTFAWTLVVQASSCVSTAIPAAISCLCGRAGDLVLLLFKLAPRNGRRGRECVSDSAQ